MNALFPVVPPEDVLPIAEIEDTAKATLIWTMYAGLIDQVKHFNGLQSTYRTFASGWLLAAFAAIVPNTSNLSMVTWVCWLSVVGMGMFCFLDFGYHKLLRSVLDRQKKMETDNPFLPQTATNMDKLFKNPGFRWRIFFFYGAAVVILIIIASTIG